MSLSEAIDRYLSLKRSLGAVYSAEARILRSLGRILGDIAIGEVDSAAVRAFVRGAGPPTRWQERKHQTLRGFFRHLVSRGHLSSSPLAGTDTESSPVLSSAHLLARTSCAACWTPRRTSTAAASPGEGRRIGRSC